ncbi:MAG: CapA family protein [Patescibacteria group bacterium]|jgi:poly-gamma-glutamate synthesis protein (capsule biosynthesis protein)
MNERTEKIIIIASITFLSLSAIFFLFRAVAAPAMPESPADPILNIFSSKKEQFSNNNPKLPLSNPKPITLIFGGDVMLSRQVNSQMTKYNDYSWPFLKIADYLSTADLTIINLESPFAESKNYNVPTGSFMFKVNPRAISGLTLASIDLVGLANNHILNQGEAGLKKTEEVLSEAGIKHIGGGENENAAHKAEIFTVKNKKIGFLAYAYPDDNSVAGAKRAGIANLNLKKMAADIEALKAEADIVVVIMHAGEEYTSKPNKQQIIFAHAAVDHGADLIVGHHPHWPQTWEYYQGKPIIYSLGNLIFDQMWSEETKIGLIVQLEWQDDWTEIKFVPIKIFDYGQAEILEDGPEKEALFKKLNIPADGKIELAPLTEPLPER